VAVADKPSQALLNAQKELEKRRRLAGIDYRAPRQSSLQCVQHGWQVKLDNCQPVAAEQSHSEATVPPDSLRVRVSPSLAAWCLDKGHRYQGQPLDGPYRLYKIMQVLDYEGRGWLANLFVQTNLTKKGSPYYIYGRRQLKNMLSRGEGLFWHRVKSRGEVRIRLVSRAKLANQLHDGRLRGREVTFPVDHMLGHGRGRQAAVNAALYAAVHAGQITCQGKSRPISRARLQDVSGCSSYRQRRYEKHMDISIDSHFYILGKYNEYEHQRTRIHEGLPAYKHTDYQGKINRHQRGADYIALRLPNSYRISKTFTVVHSRRQRTINRQMGGLCHMGSEGSDKDDYRRLFYEDAAAAVHAFNRDPNTISFYPLTVSAKAQLWRSIS
jgi:hypothetical protein